MDEIFIGYEKETGRPIYLSKSAFNTHLHLPGLTGTGKTTLLIAMMHQLFCDPYEPACHIAVDFLGGLSWEIMMWAASDWCPPEVRNRIVYIEPANKNIVLGINPLLYDDGDRGFYKVSRATDLILRAWDSQNVQEMPRLARWLFNSMYAASILGLTVSDTEILLLPGSPYHKPLLNALPESLRNEWIEILDARSSTEASRILDSSRNRMSPFYKSKILQRMFGSTQNRFDVRRFRRERKIVILNLAPQGQLSPQEQNAMASMFLNEVLADARSQPKGMNEPTYCWLDEFQRMVGPDLEYAIPEVRQLGLKMIFAHQAFSQLKHGDLDLTPLIWVPRTRFVFGLAAEDADLVANEFAALSFDPMQIKDQIDTIRQLKVGWEKVRMHAWGDNVTNSTQWNQMFGQGWSAGNRVMYKGLGTDYTYGNAQEQSRNQAEGKGGGEAHGSSHTLSEQLIEKLETFRERANTTYFNYDEIFHVWGGKVRRQATGEAIMLAANDPMPYCLKVEESRPGFLAQTQEVILAEFPREVEAKDRLIEVNNTAEMFVSPALIERETRERLEHILRPKIVINTHLGEDPTMPTPEDDIFT